MNFIQIVLVFIGFSVCYSEEGLAVFKRNSDFGLERGYSGYHLAKLLQIQEEMKSGKPNMIGNEDYYDKLKQQKQNRIDFNRGVDDIYNILAGMKKDEYEKIKLDYGKPYISTFVLNKILKK